MLPFDKCFQHSTGARPHSLTLCSLPLLCMLHAFEHKLRMCYSSVFGCTGTSSDSMMSPVAANSLRTALFFRLLLCCLAL